MAVLFLLHSFLQSGGDRQRTNNPALRYRHAHFSELFSALPFSFADVDECQIHNGGCQHRCVNTFGSYYCECKPGFRLHTDGRTCIGKSWLSVS